MRGSNPRATAPDAAPPEASKRMTSFAAVRGNAKTLLRSRTAWQTASYVGATLLANGFTLIATVVLTRRLGTDDFGSYSFAFALLVFLALFFEFGLFVPAARLAAVVDQREQREIVGAALLVYLPVGAAFSATVFVASSQVDRWFHVDAGHALRLAAVVAIGFPFAFVLQQLAQGADRLHVASLATFLAPALFVALLGLFLAGGGDISTASALVLRSLALLIAAAASAMWLRPAFRGVRIWAPEFVRQARDWGSHLFVGRVLSIGTYNMDVLMLGLWASSRSVGLYALAGSLAAVSGLFVTGMAAALFAHMAREPMIARRWLVIATGVGTVTALAAWLLANPVIHTVFSDSYVGAAALVLPLALAQLVRGVTTIFNNFLSAHGRGRELRNAGVVLAGSNLVFNFLLIPPFGARGAAWASLLALLANFVAHLHFYRRSYAL
jgi:O-antigen/teichoic acid export membrane protein